MKQLVLTPAFADKLQEGHVGAVSFHKGRSQYIRDRDAAAIAACVNEAHATRDEKGYIVGDIPLVVTIEDVAAQAPTVIVLDEDASDAQLTDALMAAEGPSGLLTADVATDGEDASASAPKRRK